MIASSRYSLLVTGAVSHALSAQGAIDGGDDGLEGGGGDGGVDAHAPQDLAVDLALDVAGGLRVVSLAQGVLGVVENPHAQVLMVLTIFLATASNSKRNANQR